MRINGVIVTAGRKTDRNFGFVWSFDVWGIFAK